MHPSRTGNLNTPYSAQGVTPRRSKNWLNYLSSLKHPNPLIPIPYNNPLNHQRSLIAILISWPPSPLSHKNLNFSSTQRPKLQPIISKVQQITQSEMNLVSTTKKQLHSSQQNWKLNPIPFGTSNHSLISQTPIKAPIYIKTPRPPQSLFPTINHPHPLLQYQPQPHYHKQNSNFCR